MISSWTFFWGKWESTSPTFWFQQVWGLHACGQQTVNFFHLVGGSQYLQNSLKILLCVSLDGNQDPAPRLHYCFSWLFLPCLCIPSLPWLASVWTCPVGTQRRSWRLNEAYFLLSRNGGHRRLLCPGAPLVLGFTSKMKEHSSGSCAAHVIWRRPRAHSILLMLLQTLWPNFLQTAEFPHHRARASRPSSCSSHKAHGHKSHPRH